LDIIIAIFVLLLLLYLCLVSSREDWLNLAHYYAYGAGDKDVSATCFHPREYIIVYAVNNPKFMKAMRKEYPKRNAKKKSTQQGYRFFTNLGKK
jgi:hypothetical protein